MKISLYVYTIKGIHLVETGVSKGVNHMEYKVRPMKEEDWNRVGSIYKQGIDGNGATFQTSVPDYKEWDEGHLKVARCVMTYGEQVVGWAALSPTSSRPVYSGVTELSIYIDNDFKGKGIGKKLIEYIIKESEANGIWTLYSSIMEDNEASRALHIKCGFREIGYREKIAKDQYGNWRNTVLYERRSKKFVD